MMADDNCDKLQQQDVVTMTTEDNFTALNELLQQVDANIVKTAKLRKQMPVMSAQLLAKRCRFQLNALVSISQYLPTV